MKFGSFAAAVALACTILMGQQFSRADTVYAVAPYTLTSGYQVTGGFITTDGTIGESQVDFFRSNIIDYQINISGPINFVFSPSNRNASIFTLDRGMFVTETGIWVEPSDTQVQELRLGANELNVTALNSQQMVWGHGPIGNDASFVSFIAGGPGDQGSFRQSPRVDRLLIAGSLPAAVPEPSSGICGAFLAMLLLAKRRRAGALRV